MKALTVRQPWATLLVLGVKSYETRSWTPRENGGGQVTGPIAIHAAKEFGRRERAMWCDFRVQRALRFHGIFRRDDLPLGRIVGVCELGTIRPAGEVLAELPEDSYDRLLGNFAGDRRVAWPLRPLVRVDGGERIAGQRALWDLPPALARRLERAIAPPEVTVWFERWAG